MTKKRKGGKRRAWRAETKTVTVADERVSAAVAELRAVDWHALADATEWSFTSDRGGK